MVKRNFIADKSNLASDSSTEETIIQVYLIKNDFEGSGKILSVKETNDVVLINCENGILY